MSLPQAQRRRRRTPRRWASRARGALLFGIGLLFAASIPWYRDASAVPGRLIGLPDWVAVALLCYALAAAFNALAWLLTEVPDGLDPSQDERP